MDLPQVLWLLYLNVPSTYLRLFSVLIKLFLYKHTYTYILGLIEKFFSFILIISNRIFDFNTITHVNCTTKFKYWCQKLLRVFLGRHFGCRPLDPTLDIWSNFVKKKKKKKRKKKAFYLLF